MIKILLVINLIFIMSCTGKKDTLAKRKSIKLDPLTIMAEVDNANPTNVDRIKYTIKYSYEDGVDFSPSEIGSEIANFRIVDNDKEGPKKIDGRNILTMWYALEPDVDGTYILPPVVVKYTFKNEEKTVNTNPIYINVAVADIADNETILENDELANIPDDRLWFYSVIILGGLLLGGLVIYLVHRLSTRKKIVPPLTPYEQAQNELRELKYKNFLSQKEYRNFYFSLSEILRRYIDGCFDLNTLESTQEEIGNMFKKTSRITQEEKTRLLAFFTRSDFIKYAKKESTEETSKGDLSIVETFIEESNQRLSKESNDEDKNRQNV